jgi:hypothetical protein
MLGAHGICPKNIGLESPEQLGRVERHGKLWKTVAKRVIHAQKLRGESDMRNMACCTNTVLNDGVRKGGFAASQWVLGKFPRTPGDMFNEDEFADLGCINEKVDGESAFYKMTQIRMACKKAFAEADCSHKIANITLRKAAPTPSDYAVGDLICFRRENQGAGPRRLKIDGRRPRESLDSTDQRWSGV